MNKNIEEQRTPRIYAQFTFRGQYIGRYITEAEARAKLKELQAITPRKKGSGGKREGSGRKKKESQSLN